MISKSKKDFTAPFIEQRADPWVFKHTDGYYYFIATVPDFDKIELRRAAAVEDLPNSSPKVIWTKHAEGPMAAHIWAPELHYIDGKWYIYFAAGNSDAQWHIRIYVLENLSENPLEGNWIEKGQLKTNWDSFSLDATTFEHNNKRYLVWAQKDTNIEGNSNLYIAAMKNPWTIEGRQVLLSKPEYEWEKRGFLVNEGPAVLKKNGKIFISYSASATDENYCMGLLETSEDSDLLNSDSWTKYTEPVFTTSEKNGQYGPGHNSFTISADGKYDILVYHARNYPGYNGDALSDPNRHTYLQPLKWNTDGTPNFKLSRAAAV